MPALDPINLGVVIVGVITALGAWATQKTSARTNRLTAKDAHEAAAYNRAREMDIRTIDRQKEEIAEFEKEQNEHKARIKELELENQKLRGRRAISEK